MNEFERRNLERLAKLNSVARDVKQQVEDNRKDHIVAVSESSIRLIVRCLFELKKGDLEEIKSEIRKDSELIKGLNLEKIVNDEYKRQANPQRLRARYDEQTQRKFWTTVWELERQCV